MEDESVPTTSLDEVEAIYRSQLAVFRRVAAAVSGDRDAAADLVQEAFVRAVRELESFGGRGSLDGWLWRIVVNVAKNHRRDARPLAELPDELTSSTNGYAPSEVERVRAAIGLLPERQRMVLFLRYYADLDYGAIAQAAEISPGTVGATLSAARSSLQQLLFTQEATP
jgi:RNA polymerase sigma-70 factor, ECF subfamily